jgi:vanillate O-demethylase ferredoxin subunit
MHTSLRVGDVLHVTPPSNDFPLDETVPESVFIVGGIGITPAMSMLARLEKLGRPWRLYYASRTPRETAFVDELRRLDQGRGRVEHCYRSSRAQRLDIRAIVGGTAVQTHLYCCGPSQMIDAFLEACSSRPAHTVHHERFAASQQAATEGGFEVVLHRSGQRLRVEQGKSILDTLLDHNVSVQYACSSGICGTCRTGVIDGDPDHRDDFLSAEEKCANESMMVCCSGSHSKTLVLDL